MKFLVILTLTSIFASMLNSGVVAAWYRLENGFNVEEKQRIVNLHNYYRARIARGDEAGQTTTVANMLAMTWDDGVAEKAQFWAEICLPVNDAPRDRVVKPYNTVGQNMANGLSINEAVKSWYDQVTKTKFQFDEQKCEGDCSEFTQLVWWKSWNLGCGQSRCKDKKQDTNFVCNYAPGGNEQQVAGSHVGDLESVYKTGPPCSACPNGFGYCMNGALCASKDQCFTTATPCTCTITSCENGGLFDEYTCSCLCQTGFKGLRCEALCVDQDDFCEVQEADCAWDGSFNSYARQRCEKTCEACGPMENFDGLNKDGVTTHVYNLTNDLSCVNKASDNVCEGQAYVCSQMPAWAADNCARYCGSCRPEPGPGVEAFTEPAPATLASPTKSRATTATVATDTTASKKLFHEKQEPEKSGYTVQDQARGGKTVPNKTPACQRVSLSSVFAIVLVFFAL